jgi:transposase
VLTGRRLVGRGGLGGPALRDHLIAAAVSLVVMEAAGSRSRTTSYFVPEDGLEVMPVNARHVKNVPGARPTSAMPNGRPDPAHAALVRGSFAPPEPIRSIA